jgi:hypothetical protein
MEFFKKERLLFDVVIAELFTPVGFDY